MRRGWGASTIGACVFIVTSAWAGSAAADPVDDTLKAAKADVDAGRCEQAASRLEPIEGLQNRARLLGGLCLIKTGRYPEALANLDRARGARDLTATQVGDVELYRGVALYHLERYSESSAALAAAEGLTSEPAELSLYRGLIALRSGDNERAAPDLEAAALLSPALTEPVASYYAGLAWQGASQRDNARAAFQRVIDVDGVDGPWGRQARELLGTTDPFPYFVRGSVGVEYDDNVLLRGGVTQFSSPDQNLPSEAGQKDWLGVWTVDGGVQLLDAGSVGAGITAGYSGNSHVDLGEFDTQYPRVGGYVVNRFGPNTTGQLRYEFGAAWVHDHSFLRTQLAEAGLTHTWEEAGTTVLVADLLWNDLRYPTEDLTSENVGGVCTPATSPGGCGPVGLNEGRARDRDGTGVGGALEHRYLIPVPEAVDAVFEEVRIGGGYRYRYYVSDGSEWKYMSHILSAALEFEFPLDISLSTRVSYEYRDFANPSTYPDHEQTNQPYSLSSRDRHEQEINFTAELDKDLSENVSISARWSYLDNNSNTRVYDYTRNIVGAYVNVHFD